MNAEAPIRERLARIRSDLNGRLPTGVSIAARMTLSAHALNNEGSRNNATIPRQINVVHGDDIVQANAVSGDILKHAFVSYIRAVALDAEQTGDLLASALPLCVPCRNQDPNRLNSDSEFQVIARSKEAAERVLDEVVRRCVIDDVAGLLVTQGNRNAPRTSTVQFDWELGIPERVRTGRYVHLKLVPGDQEDQPTDGDGSNLGQNLFTKPASSGMYAFLALCDLSRIGWNDLTQQYVVPEQVRLARGQAALEALYLTVAAPDGAQRNTQFPHFQGATGAVGLSISSFPPTLYSPLEDDFVTQMARIAAAFNRLDRDLFVLPFTDVGELGEILAEISSFLSPAAVTA